MRSTVIDEPALERALLRKSVGALRDATERCYDCRRTPLIGERVHHYEGSRLVCELCRALRREAPVRSDWVRGIEFGHHVRITVRAAAA